MPRLVGALALLLLLPIPAAADDAQAWITTMTSGAVGRDWRVAADLHGRWVNDAADFQRTVVRLQAGRALPRGIVVWFGGENTWAFAGRTASEQRLWQQITWIQPAGRWQIAHRGRLEERFIDGVRGVVPRVRYQFRVVRPLGPEGRWTVGGSAEIFMRLRAQRTAEERLGAGYDRERLQVGVGRRLSARLSMEPAYALQRIRLPGADRREHILQLGVIHRF